MPVFLPFSLYASMFHFSTTRLLKMALNCNIRSTCFFVFMQIIPSCQSSFAAFSHETSINNKSTKKSRFIYKQSASRKSVNNFIIDFQWPHPIPFGPWLH